MAPIVCGPNLWRWGSWVEQIPSPPPPLDVRGIRFFQFNMCGSVCNQGDVVGVVDAIAGSLRTYEPDVVILNEACLAQADRLWDELAGEELLTSGCFGATTGWSQCPGEEGQRWFGNALFCRGCGIGEPELIPLPNRPGVEERSVLSMVTDLHGVETSVSATHLVPRGTDNEFNRLQITEVARIHNARAASGAPVVLGGDFNVTPRFLTEILSPGGCFRDVDHADNEPTLSTRKIDYVLLDVNRFRDLWGDATRSNFSDHRPLRGSATLRSTG